MGLYQRFCANGLVKRKRGINRQVKNKSKRQTILIMAVISTIVSFIGDNNIFIILFLEANGLLHPIPKESVCQPTY